MFRFWTLPICLLLGACNVPWTTPAGAWLGVDVASVIVFGRSTGDILLSTVTGRDCSVVHLDAGKTYCQPPEHPPGPPPYCTRTLGDVNCWEGPGVVPNPPPGLADTPDLTPEQERAMLLPWPARWF